MNFQIHDLILSFTKFNIYYTIALRSHKKICSEIKEENGGILMDEINFL